MINSEDQHEDDLVLDLTQAAGEPDELALELGSPWKQLDAVELLAPVIAVRTQPVVETSASLPSVAEFSAAKLAQELGYSEILTVGALEDGIRFYQQRTAEACLELGKRLLLLKELAPHGEFLKRIELLGFSNSSAYRFMSATRKSTKLPNMGTLVQKASSQAKLLELLVLDGDDLEDLAAGNEAAGITLDEIELMTATELRKALRAHKDATLPDEKAKPLTDEIESLHKKIGFHEKHYTELELKLENSERKLKHLTNAKLPGKDAFSPETQAIREEAYALEYGAGVYITALNQLLEKTLNEPAPTTVESDIRFDALGIAASGIYAGIDKVFQTLQNMMGVDAMPPELAGKHILTDSEKERLEDCKIMINHDYKTKLTRRDVARDEDNRKPAGRPAGSGNKTKG